MRTNLRSSLLHRLVVTALLASAGSAHADYYVIVNAAGPVRSLSTKEAGDLFMGRSRAYANGDFVLAFDLPRDSAAREGFYRALTGMSAAQINSYWARLMFTGQTMPPQPLPNEQAMLDVVKRNPSAIGYARQEPSDPGLRVALVVKETP